MADTVNLDEITEYRDEPSVLDEKIRKLATLIRESKHMIFFTGAGISTSASIPDFRGPNGVWTRKAQGKAAPACIDLTKSLATPTHKVINELVNNGVAKFVVSQNVDGLHVRSGLQRDKLAELHGNSFLEVCWNCDHSILHETDVCSSNVRGCTDCRKRVQQFCHCTGRSCPKCGGKLKDSIIHFGEGLPQKDLENAFEHANLADLCIVAGSSCRVSPANEVPKIVGKKKDGKLVIINLQTTPLDKYCKLRIYGDMDTVFTSLKRYLSADAQPQPREISDVKRQVEVIQDCIPLRDGTFKWRVRVEPEDAVEWVKFNLHPTFTPREVTVICPPFELQRTGWGTFDLELDLKLVDRDDTVRHTHTLTFAEGEFTSFVQE